jgi:hypothetical protein
MKKKKVFVVGRIDDDGLLVLKDVKAFKSVNSANACYEKMEKIHQVFTVELVVND